MFEMKYSWAKELTRILIAFELLLYKDRESYYM